MDPHEKHGPLSIITLKGGEDFLKQVDNYLVQWHNEQNGCSKSHISKCDWPRFGTGEAKGIVRETLRGHDVFIIADVFNYGVTYKMYGKENRMSPDDHFQDLKRLICAIEGKASRITVIMPMLYEGRQHRRTMRESLDCSLALQELVSMGVNNIITFDAHDSRVQNSIPLHGFDNVHPTYQMLKAYTKNIPDFALDKNQLTFVSPDEGGLSRCMYYASVLGLDLGMFYKRRNYSVIVDGTNPIEAHEYLGRSVKDKDVIVVDDMISSGGSMIDVATQLKAKGAKRIFVFCSFGLFCNGLERFDKAYEDGLIDKIFTTNLIYSPDELLSKPWYCQVNMCKYVAIIIDTLNKDESISGLLNPVDRINRLVERVSGESKK